MDRRSALSLFRTPEKKQTTASAPMSRPIAGGLEPYTGPWTKTQAAHLLRRTTFGPTVETIHQSFQMGLPATLEALFADLPMPELPRNYTYASDPQVPIGQTWVDRAYTANNNAVVNYRNNSLRAWIYDLILQEGISIREKLVLFWHNHFATSDVNDPVFLYHHLNLLRTRAWGNFRELVKDMTIDPTMLRFLNGNQNTRTGRNENYARELLELFTIGKGPQAGPGDYTHYTESDVSEIARALTGWRDLGYRTVNTTQKPGVEFRPTQHDTGTKTLSHRFGNALIPNLNTTEYKFVVDLIFQQKEVARFICRKLYRWFVYYQITEEAESQVIEPMAQLLIDSGYEIKPALQALLQSAHFFDALNVGPMIKNPIDFSLGLLKQTQAALPSDPAQRANVLISIFRTIALQQMEYLNPPDVAGWKAYYQEPAFYRIWINATTLGERMKFTDRFALEGHRLNNFSIRLDPLKLISNLENPEEPNDLIHELAALLLPQPLTAAQHTELKDVLLPGLPDFVWTIEYNLYLSKPNDQMAKTTVESKLRSLFQAMFTMAEYFLS